MILGVSSLTVVFFCCCVMIILVVSDFPKSPLSFSVDKFIDIANFASSSSISTLFVFLRLYVSFVFEKCFKSAIVLKFSLSLKNNKKFSSILTHNLKSCLNLVIKLFIASKSYKSWFFRISIIIFSNSLIEL